jgi:hypothetical protein
LGSHGCAAVQAATRNPLKPAEIDLTKTLSHAAVALGDRIDHLEQKVSVRVWLAV